MTKLDIILKLRLFDILDDEAFRLYIDLIFDENAYDEDDYYERHHILPKSMFPEYIKCKWNIVNLSYDNHVLAHEYLARFYQNLQMKRAFNFMLRDDLESRKKHALLLSDMHSGDNNPARLPGVGAKISKAKMGQPRPDMYGKKYFGADPETVKAGLAKMAESKKGFATAKDKDGNMYYVSVNDPRYKSGELVGVSKGLKFDNHWLKEEGKAQEIVEKRREKYKKFETFSLNEMVDFLVESYKNGKTIFGTKRPFSSNYSKFVNYTNFEHNELKEAVVQRLEKDNLITN